MTLLKVLNSKPCWCQRTSGRESNLLPNFCSGGTDVNVQILWMTLPLGLLAQIKGKVVDSKDCEKVYCQWMTVTVAIPCWLHTDRHRTLCCLHLIHMQPMGWDPCVWEGPWDPGPPRDLPEAVQLTGGGMWVEPRWCDFTLDTLQHTEYVRHTPTCNVTCQMFHGLQERG